MAQGNPPHKNQIKCSPHTFPREPSTYISSPITPQRFARFGRPKTIKGVGASLFPSTSKCPPRVNICFFWDPVTWIALYLTLYQIFLCHFNTDNISPSDVSTQCNLKTRSCWIILRLLSKEARPVVWLRQVTHLSSNNCIGWFLCSQQLQWLIEPVCWCLLDILASLSSLEPKYWKLKDIQKLWKGDSWKLETSKWYKISFEKKSVFSYWISPKTYWD